VLTVPGRQHEGGQGRDNKGFAMGIQISKFDVEKSLEDFRATLEIIKIADKWDEETTSS
jgi:hypothetical protein